MSAGDEHRTSARHARYQPCVWRCSRVNGAHLHLHTSSMAQPVLHLHLRGSIKIRNSLIDVASHVRHHKRFEARIPVWASFGNSIRCAKGIAGFVTRWRCRCAGLCALRLLRRCEQGSGHHISHRRAKSGVMSTCDSPIVRQRRETWSPFLFNHRRSRTRFLA